MLNDYEIQHNPLNNINNKYIIINILIFIIILKNPDRPQSLLLIKITNTLHTGKMWRPIYVYYYVDGWIRSESKLQTKNDNNNIDHGKGGFGCK